MVEGSNRREGLKMSGMEELMEERRGRKSIIWGGKGENEDPGVAAGEGRDGDGAEACPSCMGSNEGRVMGRGRGRQ